MAIKTMQTPISMATPILKRLRAISKSIPSPLAPIREASTTIAKHCMITWLTPIKMSRRAVGMSTLVNNCQSVQPLITPDSATSGGNFLSPNSVRRTMGGVAKITVAIAPA